jgi:hypothetical protein
MVPSATVTVTFLWWMPVVGILFRLALEKCLAIIVDVRLGASPETWRHGAEGGGKKRGGWWGG